MTSKKNCHFCHKVSKTMKKAIKNNYLPECSAWLNTVTTLSSAGLSFVTVVTAKDSELSQLQLLETRAVTGSAPACDESDTCDSSFATSLNSLFLPTTRGHAPMTNKPHFLIDPVDPQGQAFRADCMAWELYTKKSKAQRQAFIAGNPALQTAEFNQRLRRCEAWWLLAHCTHHQIESTVAEMQPAEMKEVRQHLDLMRLEMKKVRQIKHKTFMGDLANA